MPLSAEQQIYAAIDVYVSIWIFKSIISYVSNFFVCMCAYSVCLSTVLIVPQMSNIEVTLCLSVSVCVYVREKLLFEKWD